MCTTRNSRNPEFLIDDCPIDDFLIDDFLIDDFLIDDFLIDEFLIDDCDWIATRNRLGYGTIGKVDPEIGSRFRNRLQSDREIGSVP